MTVAEGRYKLVVTFKITNSLSLSFFFFSFLVNHKGLKTFKLWQKKKNIITFFLCLAELGITSDHQELGMSFIFQLKLECACGMCVCVCGCTDL